MSEDANEELGGADTVATATTIVNDPELAYDDGDTGVSDTKAGVTDSGVGSSDSHGDAESDEGDDPGKHGFFPCYRTFQQQWFWTEKPWDIAHLFMDLLLRANRAKRTAKHGGAIIEIRRGALATSFTKLEEVTGRNRKTVRKWLGLLTQAGEISTQNKGQHGVVITITKYDSYARDKQNEGQSNGRRSPRR